MADKKISALTASSTPLAGTEVLPIVQSGATVKVAVSDLTAGRAVATAGLTNTGSANLGASATNVTAGGYTTKVSGMSITTDGTTWLGSYGGAILNSDNQYSSGARRWGLFSGVNITNFGIAHSTTALTDPVLGGNGGTMSSGTLDLEIDTSSNVKINVGNLVIGTSGKGIDFSATSGSGTSELLADYEEGTWSPVLTPASGTITPNATYTGGTYTKIGNLVTVNGCIYVTSVSAPSGLLSITGLPFATKAGTQQYRAGAVAVTDMAATLTTSVQLSTGPNLTELYLSKVVAGVASDLAGDVKAASDIRFSITYQV